MKIKLTAHLPNLTEKTYIKKQLRSICTSYARLVTRALFEAPHTCTVHNITIEVN